MIWIILLIGVIVRVGVFVATVMEPLWYDEHFSRAVSALPWSQLWAATAGDVHPPAYYALLKVWRAVLPAALPVRVEVRALSMALSIASLFLAWRVLRALPLVRDARRAALLLYAMAPGAIFYAVDARMYSLLEFCLLGAILGVLRRELWTTAAMLALAALTHNAGLLYALVIAGVAVLWGRDHLIARAGVIAAVLWGVIWAAPFVGQLGSVSAAYWIRPPSAGSVIYELWRAVFAGRIHHGSEYVMMIAFAAVLAVGVRLAVERRAWALLALAFGAPAGAIVIAALGGPSVLMARVLMPSLLFIAVILALAAARSRVALLSLLAAFVLCWGGWITQGRVGNDLGRVVVELDAPPARIYAMNNVSIPLNLLKIQFNRGHPVRGSTQGKPEMASRRTVKYGHTGSRRS